MLPESNSKTSDRFLMVDRRLSRRSLALQQDNPPAFYKIQQEKSAAQLRYMNWKASDREIAVFTLYAYADFPIPKSFNCIFDRKHPDRMVETSLKVTQSIFEGFMPIDRVEHGHKHMLILAFAHEIPSILLELYEQKELTDHPPHDALGLGICQIEDYDSIRKMLLTIKELQAKHGVKWHDYYLGGT